MGRPKTTGKRTSYGAEIDGLLADYSAVVHRAAVREIVRDAIRHFIAHQLAHNDGMRNEFDALRRQRLAAERAGLKIVSDNGEGSS